MLKWILSPIATAKRKIALFIAKRAIKRLRKATKDEMLWLAGKLDNVSNALESLARGEITAKTILDHVESAYSYSQQLLTRIKKG